MIESLPFAAASQTAASQTAGIGSASGTTQESVLSTDFETFLKMLTAQAKYQDPLEPIKSSDYAAQLAQFSMVEQQVFTNDLLTALSSQSGNTSMASLASWVGMEARAVSPGFFDGSPITVSPNPASVSDQVVLVVTDEFGREVQRQTLPISAEPIEWAGVDDDGNPFANGIYNFTVESYKDDEVILSEPAEVYGKVTEAQLQAGQVILILEGGQAILSTSVTALRDAD